MLKSALGITGEGSDSRHFREILPLSSSVESLNNERLREQFVEFDAIIPYSIPKIKCELKYEIMSNFCLFNKIIIQKEINHNNSVASSSLLSI